MAATRRQDGRRTLHEAQINKALGIFLLFFALVVWVSILFTDTNIGRLTDLGAGAVIGAIGGAMLVKGFRSARKQA